MYAYIVLSLLIGARTEELRALTWAHVDLDGDPGTEQPIPPSIMALVVHGQDAARRHESVGLRRVRVVQDR